MDQRMKKDDFLRLLKKYRYAAVILLAGILLMCLPQEEKTEPAGETSLVSQEADLQESLSRILSKVEGAGKVEVLLTEKRGEEILYQTDEQRNQSDNALNQDRQTVLVENSDRQKTGLVRQVNPPVFQGAVIVSQGADSATVRLALVEAVMGATGLPSNSIKVLKMK